MFGLVWLQNTAHAHFVGLSDLPSVSLDSGKYLKLLKINTINRYTNEVTDRQTD